MPLLLCESPIVASVRGAQRAGPAMREPGARASDQDPSDAGTGLQ